MDSHSKTIDYLNNSSQKLTNTFFLQTCIKGDFELAKELLKSKQLQFKPNIYHTNPTFALDLPELHIPEMLINPLMAAALHGNLEFIKILTSHTELNNIELYPYSPEAVVCAGINNHKDSLIYLLNQIPKDIRHTDKEKDLYNKLFMTCARRGFIDIMEILLKNEKIVSFLEINPKHETSALMLAAQSGQLETVKYLLHSDILPEKANLYHVDSSLWNALNYATITQEEKVIHYFIFDCNMAINDTDIKYFKKQFTKGIDMLNYRNQRDRSVEIGRAHV